MNTIALTAIFVPANSITHAGASLGNDAMRGILCFICLYFLFPLSASAAGNDQVLAKGSGPVPGAIVCPDFSALQAAFRSFASRRGPGPYPEYFGCSIVRPGTLMKLEGADPGGAPLVSAILPDGRRAKGVTLHDMVETFIAKPHKAPTKAAKHAPATPEGTGQAPAVAGAESQKPTEGTIPLPTLHNSPDTLCEAQRPCTDQEFSAQIARFEKQWGLMPDALRKECTNSASLPEMRQCVSRQTTTWVYANPNKDTPWMDPELFSQ